MCKVDRMIFDFVTTTNTYARDMLECNNLTFEDLHIDTEGHMALVTIVDYGGNKDVVTVSLWDVIEWIYNKGDNDE